MNQPLDEIKAEHLSNCMCLELIGHANLAIGDADEERLCLETATREKVSIGHQRIPTSLTLEGALLCTSDRTDLVCALVFMWEHDMDDHYTNLVKINKYIKELVHVLMKISQQPLELDCSGYNYIIIRAKVQFAMQCYKMTEAIIMAKKQLPVGSPPEETFFTAMLPVVCRIIDFKDLLTDQVMELFPNMW